jgi:hypothetical protein
MRTLIPLASSFIGLTLIASAARAERAPAPAPAPRPAAPVVPAVQLVPIDLANVPEACRSLAKQAVAQIAPAAFPTRISLASCMAERAIEPLALCDCGESIAAIDAAVAPAVAVLDDVIAKADPATAMIAEHAEGQLYAGFATRLLATLPRPGTEASEAEIALHDVRKQGLDAQLAGWRDKAMTAFQRTVELAKAHPEVANRPVVAAAVRDSEQQLAADVATR